jgi:hypothetical protein
MLLRNKRALAASGIPGRVRDRFAAMSTNTLSPAPYTWAICGFATAVSWRDRANNVYCQHYVLDVVSTFCHRVKVRYAIEVERGASPCA